MGQKRLKDNSLLVETLCACVRPHIFVVRKVNVLF